MSSYNVIDTSLASLETAIAQLEAAVSRRNTRDDILKNNDAELALMRMDRSRLAVDLDAALARGNALDCARADVSNRLERAISTIRDTLGGA